MNPETHITSMKSILENQTIKELQREIEEIKEVIKAITEKQTLQEIKNLITEVKNNGNRTNSTRN
jgi:membrane protein insertase Oxa1/YidC/SpoIIIJ